MQQRNISVYGIFQDRFSLERAVAELKISGFSNEEISVLMPSSESTKEFAHENTTKAPEGAATGAVAGAVIGGALGWLAGIGTIAIPGVGPFIAAGPIMGLLAGSGVGGTVGGISGALIGMGIPEYEASRYAGKINEGGMLLSVHADTAEWQKTAREVLERNGAKDVSSKSEGSADAPRVANTRR